MNLIFFPFSWWYGRCRRLRFALVGSFFPALLSPMNRESVADGRKSTGCQVSARVSRRAAMARWV